MATGVSSVALERATLFKTALAQANQKLQTHHLVVRFLSQLPKREEVVNPDSLDERPDIDLEMHCAGRWYPIDMVYLRQMPQEPEKLKSVEELAQDIYEKAMDHFEAINDRSVIITSSGTKYNTAHLKKHTFGIDSQGYLRLDGLRIVSKGTLGYMPLKENQLRSHTRTIPEELEGDVFNITDRFDKGRTDGRKGMYCVTKKAAFIALERIAPSRRDEAKGYEQDGDLRGRYIPLVRTWEEVEQLFAGSSNFF
jgi:hypothetical protein